MSGAPPNFGAPGKTVTRDPAEIMQKISEQKIAEQKAKDEQIEREAQRAIEEAKQKAKDEQIEREALNAIEESNIRQMSKGANSDSWHDAQADLSESEELIRDRMAQEAELLAKAEVAAQRNAINVGFDELFKNRDNNNSTAGGASSSKKPPGTEFFDLTGGSSSSKDVSDKKSMSIDSTPDKKQMMMDTATHDMKQIELENRKLELQIELARQKNTSEQNENRRLELQVELARQQQMSTRMASPAQMLPNKVELVDASERDRKAPLSFGSESVKEAGIEYQNLLRSVKSDKNLSGAASKITFTTDAREMLKKHFTGALRSNTGEGAYWRRLFVVLLAAKICTVEDLEQVKESTFKSGVEILEKHGAILEDKPAELWKSFSNARKSMRKQRTPTELAQLEGSRRFQELKRSIQRGKMGPRCAVRIDDGQEKNFGASTECLPTEYDLLAKECGVRTDMQLTDVIITVLHSIYRECPSVYAAEIMRLRQYIETITGYMEESLGGGDEGRTKVREMFYRFVIPQAIYLAADGCYTVPDILWESGMPVESEEARSHLDRWEVNAPSTDCPLEFIYTAGTDSASDAQRFLVCIASFGGITETTIENLISGKPPTALAGLVGKLLRKSSKSSSEADQTSYNAISGIAIKYFGELQKRWSYANKKHRDGSKKRSRGDDDRWGGNDRGGNNGHRYGGNGSNGGNSSGNGYRYGGGDHGYSGGGGNPPKQQRRGRSPDDRGRRVESEPPSYIKIIPKDTRSVLQGHGCSRPAKAGEERLDGARTESRDTKLWDYLGPAVEIERWSKPVKKITEVTDYGNEYLKTKKISAGTLQKILLPGETLCKTEYRNEYGKKIVCDLATNDKLLNVTIGELLEKTNEDIAECIYGPLLDHNEHKYKTRTAYTAGHLFALGPEHGYSRREQDVGVLGAREQIMLGNPLAFFIPGSRQGGLPPSACDRYNECKFKESNCYLGHNMRELGLDAVQSSTKSIGKAWRNLLTGMKWPTGLRSEPFASSDFKVGRWEKLRIGDSFMKKRDEILDSKH